MYLFMTFYLFICGFAFSTIQNQFVIATLKMHRSCFEIHVKSPVLHVIRLNLILCDMNITNRNERCFQSRLQKLSNCKLKTKWQRVKSQICMFKIFSVIREDIGILQKMIIIYVCTKFFFWPVNWKLVINLFHVSFTF